MSAQQSGITYSRQVYEETDLTPILRTNRQLRAKIHERKQDGGKRTRTSQESNWKLGTPYYRSDAPVGRRPAAVVRNPSPSNLSIDLPNRLAAIEAPLSWNIPVPKMGHMGRSPQCSGGSTPIFESTAEQSTVDANACLRCLRRSYDTNG